MVKETYAGAGVDIDAAARVKKEIGKLARATFNSRVLGDFGYFGGLYDLKGYDHPVLVSHADGVGTKTKIAAVLNRYDTIGVDIVSHCVNDIFTCGAEPIFFQDYIGMGKLVPEHVQSIVQGVSRACRDVGCALIGGETAEMPGVYSGTDFDLVGFIVGVVEHHRIINGQSISAGDSLIGLPSSGLHTNGYSLVRKLFRKTQLTRSYPQLERTLGEALLEPHRCYYHPVKPLLPLIKGIAHITGGSFRKNVARVLPQSVAARIDTQSWPVPPLFSLIQEQGNIDRDEMYRVFNMGIGMVLVCAADQAESLLGHLPEARTIGQVITQTGDERVLLD